MQNAKQEEIAKRAYAIWEREGRPHGRDLEHWLTAEFLARTESRPAQASESGAAPKDPSDLNRRGSRRRSPRQTSNG